MNIITWFEIQFWKIVKWKVKKDYGGDCRTLDTDDFHELLKNNAARCGSCKAKEMMEWIDNHISLLKY